MLGSIFLVLFSCEFMQRLRQLICKIEKYWYLKAPPGSRNHLVARFILWQVRPSLCLSKTTRILLWKSHFWFKCIFVHLFFLFCCCSCCCCFFFCFVFVFVVVLVVYTNSDGGLVNVSVLLLETDLQKHQWYFGIKKTCACQPVTICGLHQI